MKKLLYLDAFSNYLIITGRKKQCPTVRQKYAAIPGTKKAGSLRFLYNILIL